MRQRLILYVVMLFVVAGCNLLAQDDAPPSPDLPVVEFVYPLNNTSVLEGTDLQIQIAAQDTLSADQGGGVARVELQIDDLFHQEGSPIERDLVPIFTVEMNWLAQGVGFHSMTATAYRADGTPSTPQTIRINVIPASE